MNCHITFTRALLLTAFGKAWVQGPLKRHTQELLLRREKSRIPSSMAEVKRIRDDRAMKESSRFGENNFRIESTNPEASLMGPSAHSHFTTEQSTDPDPNAFHEGSIMRMMVMNVRRLREVIIPCPAENCRGFLEKGKCNACEQISCLKCLKPVSKDAEGAIDHKCQPSDVASVDFMLRDSRPCPNCGVFINKIAGCDHMHCTHCLCNWSWRTGMISTHTTNFHYNGLRAYAQNVATISRRRNDENRRWESVEEMATDECGNGIDEDPVLVWEDAIPVDRVSATTPREVMLALYEDPVVIRYTVNRMFDMDKLRANHDKHLLKLRTLFVLKDIDEATWSRRLFTAEHSFERDYHTATVFMLYLFAIRDLQRQLAQRIIDGNDKYSLLENHKALARLCNESLDSLRDEYGGPRIAIRQDVSDPDAPPLHLS